MKKSISSTVAISFILLAIVICSLSGCRKGGDSRSQPGASSSPAPQTPFERDLDYVRQGQFTYMFVFSRKDGGVFNSDDITYLKANSPQETNQWISSVGRRRVIAGTNFEFKQEHFDALYKRFNIENFTGK